MKKNFIYIPLFKNLVRINLTELELCETPTPFEMVVDYEKQNMPFGLGGFGLGSEIHLVGGMNYPIMYEHDYWKALRELPLNEIPGNVLVYTLNPKSREIASGNIPNMNGPKVGVMVEELDGKFYVLSCLAWICGVDLEPSEVFEVYDPCTNSWECLSCPPNYDGFIRCFYGCYGRLFLCCDDTGFWTFDVDSKQWNAWGEEGPPSWYYTDRAARYGPNVVMCYDQGCGLVAHLVNHVDMSVGRSMVLFEVELDDLKSEEWFGSVYRMEESKFCLVCLSGCRALIYIFQVNDFIIGDADFKMSVDIIKSHLYVGISGVITTFFVCEDSKRKEEYERVGVSKVTKICI